MLDFIDEHREAYGVESICSQLPIAPSTYYKSVELNAHPDKRSKRAKTDESLSKRILEIWEANYRVYGNRKIWRALLREGWDVARCTVARLMNTLEISGRSRGKKVITTNSDQKLNALKIWLTVNLEPNNPMNFGSPITRMSRHGRALRTLPLLSIRTRIVLQGGSYRHRKLQTLFWTLWSKRLTIEK